MRLEGFKSWRCHWLLGTPVPQFPYWHSITSFIPSTEMEGLRVAQDLCASMSERQQICYFSGCRLEMSPEGPGSFDAP